MAFRETVWHGFAMRLFIGPMAGIPAPDGRVLSLIPPLAGYKNFTPFGRPGRGLPFGKQDFDVSNQLRKVDFAAEAGLGYQFDNGFGLSAGYDYGLTSLDANNRFQAYNRVAKAGLSYAF